MTIFGASAGGTSVTRFTKELAQNLDCATSDHNEMVACIRSKKGEEIQNASALTEYKFCSYRSALGTNRGRELSCPPP